MLVSWSLGCSSGGATNDGGAGSGGGAVAGRGGQAGGVAGATGGSSGGASGSGGVSGSGGFNGCGMLAGLSFESIDEHECGLGPDGGVALCHWGISFTGATTFTWRHSDYIDAGSYTCSANTITAQTFSSGTVTATLEPLWRFTWSGVVYVCNGCPP